MDFQKYACYGSGRCRSLGCLVAMVSLAGAFSSGCVPRGGTNVAGQVTFPVAAIRISTISGGSGASVLSFSVIQTGKL